jgi:hypothetical protein
MVLVLTAFVLLAVVALLVIRPLMAPPESLRPDDRAIGSDTPTSGASSPDGSLSVVATARTLAAVPPTIAELEALIAARRDDMIRRDPQGRS